jgi:hypothetical protein
MVDGKSTTPDEKRRACDSRKRAMTSHNPRLLLFLCACSAAVATPASAVTQSANVKVTVVKPLTLTSLQNLDLGTITLNGGTWSGVTVGISQAGVLNCANANVVCSGATQVARYRVTGTNKQVVLISAPNVTLTNQADPSQTLTMVVDKPDSIALTSSGQPGVEFDVGGSITLSSGTADGDYTGTMDVTVEYQ